MQAASEGLAKQKDFAAKAYGFLVSCYYFICAHPLPSPRPAGLGPSPSWSPSSSLSSSPSLGHATFCSTLNRWAR